MGKEGKELKALSDLLDKTFGKGSLFRVGDNPRQEMERLSSGSLNFDKAIGGGYPKGRIIEFFGWESSGKTTLSLMAAAVSQREGGLVGFIDVEHALDLDWAGNLGVNTEDLYVAQPDYAEQSLEILDKMLDSNQFDIIIFDSVGGLVPKSELEGEMGDSKMGLQARLMSQALRKITAKVSKSKCLVIFINQLREKIGVMFGNPETTTGGNALKFYSSVRISVSKSGKLEKDGEQIGHKMKIKVVKNKTAPPFKKAESDFYYEGGISVEGEILDVGVEREIIKKSGSWFSYGDSKLGQGRVAVIELLKDNPDLVEDIIEKINKDE